MIFDLFFDVRGAKLAQRMTTGKPRRPIQPNTFYLSTTNFSELQYVDSCIHFIEETVLWKFVCLKLEKHFWKNIKHVTSSGHDSASKPTSYIEIRDIR